MLGCAFHRSTPMLEFGVAKFAAAKFAAAKAAAVRQGWLLRADADSPGPRGAAQDFEPGQDGRETI